MKQRLWRFGSPSTLLFALLLFPLPWIEIQCPNFLTGKNDIVRPSPQPPAPPPGASQKIESPNWFDEVFSYFFGPRRAVLVSQSGAQAMCGWWSYGGDIDDDKPLAVRLRRELDAGVLPSPLLGLYFGVLVIGVPLAFALRPGRWRGIVVASVAVVALVLAFIQLAVGFPLDHAYCRVPWPDILEEPGRFAKEDALKLRQNIGHTAWFWMAQAALVGAILLQPAEWWFVHRRRIQTQTEAAPPASDSPTSTGEMVHG